MLLLVYDDVKITSVSPFQAVSLLKPGGYLVYSTCSIFCEENECIIAWILQTYPEMELVSSAPIFGGPGLPEVFTSFDECFPIGLLNLLKAARFRVNYSLILIYFYSVV